MSRSLLPMDDAGIDDLVRKLETGGYVPQLLRTVDGSQLVTRRRLRTDVEKSLDEAGDILTETLKGRLAMVTLQNALGVDLSHIEEATQDLINDSGGSIVIVQGHVISSKYLDQMTIEINSLMAKMGQLTIMDLCEKYALPADWLQPQVESKLGDTIHAHADTTDRGVYYTKEFFERGKTTVCAAMNEKTSPTSLEELQKEFPHIHQRIFYSIVESLMKEHRVLGKLKGRKDNAVFVPNAHVESIYSLLDSRISQNRYLEFDTIAEADIRDPQSFAKERYPSSVILSGCIIHESLLAEIECAVEDAISADSCVDIADVLPISVSDSDYSIILNHISSMEASAESPDTVTRVLESRFVTSQRFIDGCLAKLDPAIRARVNAVHARTHAERERIHAEKEGGEGGKGKGKASGRFFRKDSPHQGEDIGPEEVAEVIQREHPEMPAVVAYAMGRHLAPFATSILQSMLASVFLPAASPSNVSSPNESGRLAASERSMSQLAELWTLILLCKRGIDLFEELVPLSETDAAATSREYVRTIVGQLPDTLQTFLSEVEAALDGKSVSTFIDATQRVQSSCPEAARCFPEGGDTQLDQRILAHHRNSLEGQLRTAETPSLILHLTILLLFQRCNPGAMLDASGRFVPQILRRLEGPLEEMMVTGEEENAFAILSSFQKGIIAALKSPDKPELESRLKGQMELVRRIGLSV